MEFASLREKISHESKARAERNEKFAELMAEAIEAGIQAGTACRPIPMEVLDRANGIAWRVDDGACGFAWIVVKPANSAFAIWAKKEGFMRPAYGGGVSYNVSAFGQSEERKAAFAGAFARVLSEAGIRAYAHSRLD